VTTTTTTTTTTTAGESLPPLRDPTAFVKAMAKVAKALGEDLVARAKDARIEPSLRQSYDDEKAAGRTGEDFLTWRNAFCDQVAASWVLCTVFVRTLEDRGFLRHRVAGPGAADRLAQFQRLFRFLSERDYLRHIFDALAEPPPSWPRDRPVEEWVGAQVFGRQSAPLWRLSPSAGALSTMLDALRATDAEGLPVFTFGRPEGVEHDGSTTRFLGDLYQDLNEGVRKRYALLQTPDFVERFILDQTLTPALQERGIAVTVCDPTCGSGHFLLGAYDRLFEARTRQEPGRPATERARQALAQVYGIDLNPYAAAIARFRLVLSMMDKAGLTALDQVPHDLIVHIYVDDALLAGKVGASQGVSQQFELGDTAVGKAAGFQQGLGFTLLDPRVAELLSSTRFDVVVGNPPYITEKDARKRDLIRQAYPRSAAGKYALAAPFVERLFDLANGGGWMGQITANSFMKREFGKKLIEEFLPTVDLFEVIDTSGAYIPGHGTPTVLLFGRQRRPVTPTVQLVRGTRGEPSTPPDPASGQVWSAIAAHHSDASFESPFITIGAIERDKLKGHPWSLGGGGAAELKELIEDRAEKRLADVAVSIGRTTHTGEDPAFVCPASFFWRRGVRGVRLVEGDAVRDFAVDEGEFCFFPYDFETAEPAPPASVVSPVRQESSAPGNRLEGRLS
jgi:SAM-dependent methyltransferase